MKAMKISDFCNIWSENVNVIRLDQLGWVAKNLMTLERQ
jgi:hypothetical protein